jgi:CheY-like chemotaxis protein
MFINRLYNTSLVLGLNILIAENEKDIAFSYKQALEDRKHSVSIAYDGEECLMIYNEKLNLISTESLDDKAYSLSLLPFDVVILDYKMPKMNGMEVAKSILKLRPNQRIIFASAFVKETLEESVRHLKQIVELMQKPFDVKALVNTIEDREISDGLNKLMLNIRQINTGIKEELNPTKDQIRDLFEGLRKIQKGRTF